MGRRNRTPATGRARIRANGSLASGAGRRPPANKVDFIAAPTKLAAAAAVNPLEEMLGAASIAKGGTTAMASALDQIEHIFILMMENRSFDHMLGYLDAANPKIVGIANAAAAGYANLLNATPYAPAAAHRPCCAGRSAARARGHPQPDAIQSGRQNDDRFRRRLRHGQPRRSVPGRASTMARRKCR